MKKKLGILSLLALALLVPTACNKDVTDDTNNPNDSLNESISNAQGELESYAKSKLSENGVSDTDNTVANIVERFKNETNGLESLNDVSNKLGDAKKAIDDAISLYVSKKNEAELNELKKDKKEELGLYASTKLTENNLTNDTSVTSTVKAGEKLIDSASTADAVNEALISAKQNVDLAISNLINANQEGALNNYKATKTNELDQYKISELEKNNVEGTTDLNNLVSLLKDQINQADSISKVDEEFVSAKSQIDTEISKLVNSKALADAKTSAIAELLAYQAAKITEANITDDGTVIEEYYNGVTSINSKDTTTDVASALANAKALIDEKIDAIKNKNDQAEALANYKQTKITYLTTKANTEFTNYNVTDDGRVSLLILDYTNKINQSTTTTAIDTLITEYEGKLLDIIEEIKANNDLANKKVEAKTEIENYANTKLTEANLDTNNSSMAVKVNSIKSLIDEKTTINDINTAVEAGKAEIDSLIDDLSNKSEAELLEQSKIDAKNSLSSYKSAELINNNVTDDGSVSTALTNANTLIDNVTNINNINSKLEEGKALIDVAINALVEAKEQAILAEAKANAISELNSYLAQELTNNDVTGNIDLTEGINLINSSLTEAEVLTNLVVAKELVDEEINTLVEAKALANAKVNAISQLESYVETELQANGVTDDGTVANAKNAGITAINQQITTTLVQNALHTAKTAIDSAIDVLVAKKEASELEALKASSIEEVSSYATAQIQSNSITDDGSISAIVNGSAARINACTTEAQINAVVATIKSEINQAINTIKNNNAANAALLEAINDAKAELLSYKNTAIEEAGITDDGTILVAYNSGITAIEGSKTELEVATNLATAKTNINNKVTTIKLSSLISSKQAELEAYANEQMTQYNVTDDGTVQAAVTAGKANISSKTTESDILAAFNSAKSTITSAIRNLIPQDSSKVNVLSYEYAENETISAEWNDSNAENALVEYKLSSDSTWTVVDDELVRDQNGIARVDIVGLKGNNYYDVRINAGHGGTTMYMDNVYVSAYDRSGYAHFNNTEGVGAYNDDGTLKDNAIVLYVTDENKNTITLSYEGVTVTGIGNILNSVGQKTSTGLTAKGGQPNTNQGIIKMLAEDNIPLVVRFIGTVSNTGLYERGTFTASKTPLIEGLTIYDSLDNGGSEGDNGHMARIKSGKDITLEGIGADATIDGWGFHFMCETSAPTLGKNFEVRNLVFINTPEDAVGMEGTQGILKDGVLTNTSDKTADIVGSVERCWVHDCEFYCPSISGPAESDKSEGDGSVDFKRGQYFTCSYNYFEGCHKTNLVGSSDSSLQFNLTYHHNYWKECGARGPLARNANIHMYNNIFEGQTDYCMNPRATAYIFSEYNSFYKCKNPQDVAGGALKSYNDNFASVIGTSNGTIVSSKTQAVSNSCKFTYRNIDYSKFEMDSNLSYIPENDYSLQTDFTEMRKEIIAKVGALDKNQKSADMLTTDDWSIFPLIGANPTSITTPFNAAPGKISKTIYAFTVKTPFNITASFSGGVLVNQAGEAIMTESGTLEMLPAGTYAIQPTNFNCDAFDVSDFKEVTISSISITEANSEELNAQRIAEYNQLVSNIPSSITYTSSCYNAIKLAMNAYDALGDLQSEVDYTKVEAAYNTYINLGVSEIEGLINNIGTVNADSYSKISAARTAYDNALNEIKNKVSNYSTLTNAEATYESFAAQNVINAITALADASTSTTKDAQEALLVEYKNVLAMYEALSSTQKTQVTNYSKLSNGINTLEDALAPYTVIDLINQIPTTITIEAGEAITAAREAYDALTTSQKALVTNYSVLVAAEATYEEIASQLQILTFGSEETSSNSFFTVNGSTSTIKGSATYNGVTYNTCLKINSQASVTFTAATSQTLTLVFNSSNSGNVISINNTNYTIDSTGIVTVTVNGDVTIKRVSGESFLFYISLN